MIPKIPKDDQCRAGPGGVPPGPVFFVRIFRFGSPFRAQPRGRALSSEVASSEVRLWKLHALQRGVLQQGWRVTEDLRLE